MAPVPYEEVNHRSFEEEAAKEFSLTRLGPGTAELRGPCPRCRVMIRVPVVTSTYKSFRLWRRSSAQPVPPPGDVHEEIVICTCEEHHPGRPGDRSGCGAFWRLEITAS
ncbi:hypothetical protein [Streptomyces tendae]|uniref:Uncharacterized protein n=1 Tax=Streptomyces tendae TaxID=1932 RepID=A0ABX6A3T7_STRTE|nr:hypothetical protein [Streptomyces tendae]QER90531.1 hypothetical protein F3L20_33540 [Streptomyces tendae]